ncbi:hypothetical protein [Bacillus sp. OK048]|uniref:hypothetical protein n=1 Tax=Bacillus sp. OK048 TaxID=1882761 RepID=UPI0008845C9D|nr:hypothetical protein [Bacillus sp. OK048]SDM85240.1 hypothetical protein SAMN05443253_10652 [Bacillus sp. OK048]
MSATTWLMISIVGYSLAAVLLIVVIFMFFKMNIPAIIGDLNGKTAARQIQKIREQNQLTGNKHHRPSAFNVERGTLTAPVSSRFGRTGKTGKTAKTKPSMSEESKRLERKGITEQTSHPIVVKSLPTEVINEQANFSITNEATTVLAEDTQVLMVEEIYSDSTEVLMNETEVLENGTEVLMNETEVLDNGTVVLAQDFGTTVLNPTAELERENVTKPLAIEFKIVKDIKITHTNEVI